MKNHKFVVGLLFSSVLSFPAQAGKGIPHTEAIAPDNALSADATLGVASLAGGDPDAHAPLVPATRTLSASGATLPVTELPANNFIDHVNAPAVFNDGGAAGTAEVLLAETRMEAHAAVAEDLTEPATEVLLLAGLSALAIAVRRQSKV